MKLVTVFEKAELEALQSGVMIEMWDRVLSTGSGKRKFLATFTGKEREKIRLYYKVFYRWYMQSGVPQQHRMPITTYNLMSRACAFFGGL